SLVAFKNNHTIAQKRIRRPSTTSSPFSVSINVGSSFSNPCYELAWIANIALLSEPSNNSPMITKDGHIAKNTLAAH
ncbi:hypothetical protein, partial [Pseudochrobactrum lubricantis]|uniref:hypothetical protein n=1 Tax=Pseudochrobactrum lubricantis TaxID=558172 RepID=UPI0035DAB5C7